MRLALYAEQRHPWSVLEEQCRRAVDDGWDGIWLCDHLLRPSPEPPGWFLECWTTLAALAVSMPHGTLGTLVSANSLRHPGVVAAMAATVQQISGGRLVLGIGAGGDDDEHAALGVPFAPAATRVAALEEACTVVRGLLGPGPVDHAGPHYRVVLDDTGGPPAVAVPLLVGAEGERGLAVVAQHADRWAVWGSPPMLATRGRRLDEHCRRIGRDPASIGRAAIVMLSVPGDTGDWPAVLRTDSDHVRAALDGYAEVGVEELIVCDHALPSAERDVRLDELRHDVRSWEAEQPVRA